LYVLNYGKLVGFHIDPIEKKPFYHYYPNSKVLSISTLGCNFKCPWCLNWDTTQFHNYKPKEIGREQTNKLIKKYGYSYTPKDIIKYCKDNNLEFISYTYNEPTISLEFYLEVIKLAKKNKIKNLWVSNGYFTTETLNIIKPHLDAINIDVKGFTNDFYLKYTNAKIEFILRNIELVYKSNIWLEISSTIITDENINIKDIKRIGSRIINISNEIPWHIQRFYPDYRMLDKIPTPEKEVYKIQKYLQELGFMYVYSDNVDNDKNTLCPQCRSHVIKRKQSQFISLDMYIQNHKGFCKKCNFKVAGEF